MGHRYLQTEIQTASPVALVARLYSAALEHTRAAIDADAGGRLRERGERISRVIAIVGELRSAVDLERGDEIAKNLDALYAFVGRRLLTGVQHDCTAALGDVLTTLEPLHAAWQEIAAAPPEDRAPQREGV